MRMRQLFVPVLLAGVLAVGLLVLPGIGSADPNLSDVPVHQHWLVTGTGADMVFLARVGPNLCENPNLQNAFNEYHNNAHNAGPTSIGPAAPGLHNGKGAEIVSRSCSFQPPS